MINGKFDIVLINMLNGEKLFDIDFKHFGPINSICFNENDNKIITGGLRWIYSYLGL